MLHESQQTWACLLSAVSFSLFSRAKRRAFSSSALRLSSYAQWIKRNDSVTTISPVQKCFRNSMSQTQQHVICLKILSRSHAHFFSSFSHSLKPCFKISSGSYKVNSISVTRVTVSSSNCGLTFNCNAIECNWIISYCLKGIGNGFFLLLYLKELLKLVNKLFHSFFISLLVLWNIYKWCFV